MKVGITGSLASGKTTASKILSKSLPAFPTKGTPWLLVSKAGASSTINKFASASPDPKKKLFDISQSVISFEFGEPITTENYSFDDRDYLTEKIKTNIKNMKID